MSDRARALYAYMVSAIVLAVVAAPGFKKLGYDSFPASSYPMFARGRAQSATIRHVVAITDDGRHRPIPPPLIANDEVLQAAATIALEIRSGRAAKLCQQVAKRVAGEPRWQEFTWLEVTSDRYDVITYFNGTTKPQSRDIHARCRIRR